MREREEVIEREEMIERMHCVDAKPSGRLGWNPRRAPLGRCVQLPKCHRQRGRVSS